MEPEALLRHLDKFQPKSQVDQTLITKVSTKNTHVQIATTGKVNGKIPQIFSPKEEIILIEPVGSTKPIEHIEPEQNTSPAKTSSNSFTLFLYIGTTAAVIIFGYVGIQQFKKIKHILFPDNI